MKLLAKTVAAASLLAYTVVASAQGNAAKIHKEALNMFGTGYATASLAASVPPAQRNANGSKPRLVKLVQGQMSIFGSARDNSLRAASLKLTSGDFPELALQIGATQLKSLLIMYGAPEAQDARRLIYRGVSEICVDHLVFHIGSGVLQAIEWEWCYD